MKLPQEIEVWYIIPAIRREMTRIMLKRGLRQKDVAEKLGVTDAAVSQYLKSKRASQVRFDSEMIGEIKKSVERVMKGGSIMRETQRLVRLCRERGTVCKAGKRFGDAPKECKICFEKVCFDD